MNKLKFYNAQVVFSEVPDETTLAINISNCPCNCEGCHSSYLAENIGVELDAAALIRLINDNKGITCVSIMGGDINPKEVEHYSELVKNIFNLKYAWYSGRDILPKDIDFDKFDYIKVGSYKKDLGGLDNPNTNQRMYKIVLSKNSPTHLEDITYKFRKNETKN